MSQGEGCSRSARSLTCSFCHQVWKERKKSLKIDADSRQTVYYKRWQNYIHNFLAQHRQPYTSIGFLCVSSQNLLHPLERGDRKLSTICLRVTSACLHLSKCAMKSICSCTSIFMYIIWVCSWPQCACLVYHATLYHKTNLMFCSPYRYTSLCLTQHWLLRHTFV